MSFDAIQDLETEAQVARQAAYEKRNDILIAAADEYESAHRPIRNKNEPQIAKLTERLERLYEGIRKEDEPLKQKRLETEAHARTVCDNTIAVIDQQLSLRIRAQSKPDDALFNEFRAIVAATSPEQKIRLNTYLDEFVFGLPDESQELILRFRSLLNNPANSTEGEKQRFS